MYKIGDKLICKKNFYQGYGDNTHTEYVKNEEYYVYNNYNHNQNDFLTYFIISSNSEIIDDRYYNSTNKSIVYCWLKADDVIDHFYTVQELRKVKLKKLKKLRYV